MQPETHARTTDPWTSHAAAAARHTFATGHAAKVLACLQLFGPQTKDEIAGKTGLTSVQVDRRLPDLKTKGLAHPTGETRQSLSGRPERVWAATTN